MYSGTNLGANQISMRVFTRTPEAQDIEGLTVAHAPEGATTNFEAWAVTRPDDGLVFSIRAGESRAFAMLRRLMPERALLEFLAWDGVERVAALTRALDSFQLVEPALEVDALVPLATSPLYELLGAGFDLVAYEDAKLRLRRPAGLDGFQLVARWRY